MAKCIVFPMLKPTGFGLSLCFPCVDTPVDRGPGQRLLPFRSSLGLQPGAAAETGISCHGASRGRWSLPVGRRVGNTGAWPSWDWIRHSEKLSINTRTTKPLGTYQLIITFGYYFILPLILLLRYPWFLVN
jgi:hypothetical protein